MSGAHNVYGTDSWDGEVHKTSVKSDGKKIKLFSIASLSEKKAHCSVKETPAL